jgi:hypothetical protein
MKYAAAVLLAVVVLAFTQCEGPAEPPKSPSYLPQR